MARRPEMISKSWLSFELSMYSDRVAKNGETSSFPPPPETLLILVFTGTIGSDPKDLRVHRRGCRTILAVSGSPDLGFGSETGTAGDLGGRSGKEDLKRRPQRTVRAGAAMGEVCDRGRRDSRNLSTRTRNHIREGLTWPFFCTLKYFSVG